MNKRAYTNFFIIWTSLFGTLSVLLCVLACAGAFENINQLICSKFIALESPALTVFAKIISFLGRWYIYMPLSILLLAIPKTRVKIGIPVAATLLLSTLLNSALKIIFKIPRPDVMPLSAEIGYGFPSGHVMAAAALSIILLYLLFRYNKNAAANFCYLILFMFFIVFMALSRLY